MSDTRTHTAERELLLACAAAAVTPVGPARVVMAAARDLDWGVVNSRAWHHGIVPLVHGQLADAVSHGAVVPPAVLDRLSAAATAIAATNLRLTSALIDVLAALEGEGVNVLAYKGPVLAMRAYGNLALRHFNDLDVFIRRRDLSDARRVMEMFGYRLHDPADSAAARAAMRWGHHFSFVRDPNVLVEVHWRFHKPLFGSTLPDEDVWRSARRMDVAGRTVTTLAPVHELLVLATHAAWHGWSQLSWVCDFAALLARTGVEGAELLAQARRYGCGRPLLLALHLAQDLLGATAADGTSAALHAAKALDRAARLVSRRILAGTAADYRSVSMQLALREGLAEKAAFAVRATFVPTPADIRAMPLPEPLFPLYYLLRPVRVALKYRPRRVPRFR